ncbi:hypothetical protein [Candidatus Nitrosotalea okcheonensis]|uniref:Uncharacterized protein n=1 Tax=Candidatus Nitrosotalea okcheonensis TaxID=1903276 RepID=A0A2H1FFN4_9ARCH|nr:hypothetical protein [Candidatus Nitrosotalea okcheonensis]SMH71585.1 protein of unknown function [Candidatus Nitrosotalea okcheonensis]
MQAQQLNTYRKVQVDPKIEAKMIGALRKSGQPFRAVSRTEYYISKKQCDILSKLNIPYTKL